MENEQTKQTEQKQKPAKKTNNLADLSKLMEELKQQEETDTPQAQTSQEKKTAFNEHRNGTYMIVSLMAYLIGIEKDKFGHGDAPFLEDSYNELEQKKEARIIRNLCRIRAAMERNYAAIFNEFYRNVKNIGTVPELIPTDAVEMLSRDGINIYKTRPDIDEYLIAINNEISNRINNIAFLFPEWINWNYIKPIFIMPNGTKKEGIKKAGEIYNSDRGRYPYQCWINWEAVSVGLVNKGNILYDDEKFVKMIYEVNQDFFENLSLVRDVGNETMRNLYGLLDHNSRCIIVVDCENSDAVKLAAAFSSLPESQLGKIYKVLLFDSEYTTDQWKTLVNKAFYTAVNGKATFELEHIVVPRVNENKSQVDMTLALRTSKEVYRNAVDSVILVSSDSDYWAMIQALEGIRFLVMLERRKTGQAIMDTLALHNIPFCFIDDFCTAATYAIKTSTLINGIQEQIDSVLAGTSEKPFNIREMMDYTLHDSWIYMTEKEKEAFYNRYLMHMKMSIGQDGTVSITIQN